MMGARIRLATALALAAASGPACQKTTSPSPALALACSANPTAGPAPLTVAFAVDVGNAVGTLSYGISYGDGTEGSDPSARHVDLPPFTPPPRVRVHQAR